VEGERGFGSDGSNLGLHVAGSGIVHTCCMTLPPLRPSACGGMLERGLWASLGVEAAAATVAVPQYAPFTVTLHSSWMWRTTLAGSACGMERNGTTALLQL
jgi:hypothetical protein